MPASFDALWERLLRGGVARRPARRYMAELQDHLDDLIAEERRVAGDEPAARSRALARLGSVEVLASAMIERRELRAWSRKAPIATYLIAPPIALAVCTALAMAGVVLTSAWVRGAGGAASDLPAWSRSLAAGVVLFSNAMLPVLLGWGLGVIAIRERSSLLWPVSGMVIIAVLSAAVQVGVTLPSATGQGEIEIVAGFGTSFPRWSAFAGRFALNAALTLAPYLSFRLTRLAHADRDGAPV